MIDARGSVAGRQREPLVSICITSYNYGRFIAQAIDSALQQSYQNIEVVVTDNRSSDDTPEILKKYRDEPRLRVFTNAKTVSMVANHNAAIRNASGEYIVVLSADDLLLPQHVSTLLARILDPNDPVDLALGQVAYCNEFGQPLGTPHAYAILPIDYSRRDEFALMLQSYSRMFPAKMIPKSVYERLGYFDESISRAFDVDFSLRMEQANLQIGVLHKVVAQLRIHAASASTSLAEDLTAYLRDKVTYLEKVVATDEPWKLEYIGERVALSLENERNLVPIEALDEALVSRSNAVATALRASAATRHSWPSDRELVTIIVHSHGTPRELFATFNAMRAQQWNNIEVLVVQTKGVGIEYLLTDLPDTWRIRYVEAQHIQSSGAVYALGIELSRARYVMYVQEGQTLGCDEYTALVQSLESSGADFVYVDAPAVSVVEQYATPVSGHTPFVPVMRGEISSAPGEMTFSQIIVRRHMLIGLQFLAELDGIGAEYFIEALKTRFTFISFELARTVF
jgi:GT2 family glycosyltransferase